MSNQVSNLFLSPLDLRLPQIISETPIIHFIQGSSDEKYKVNINEYTCTCPDWQKVRSRFTKKDVRRLCKHISGIMTLLPFSWILPIPVSNCDIATVEIEGYFYVLIRRRDGYWINVSVRNRIEQIYNYGYNTSEKRWSYKMRPRHQNKSKDYY